MPQAIPVIIGAIKAAIAKITLSAVITFAVKTAIVFGVSKLLAKRSLGGFGQDDAGARVQLPPASQNMLPVVYGRAFVKPTIVDAKISQDQKTMWYVCALAEVSDNQGGGGGSYTWGDFYWNGAKCNFGPPSGIYFSPSVRSTTNNAGQTDNKMDGSIFIYRFPNGSASGQTSGGLDARTLLSNSQIPANLRWTGPSSIYTTGDNAGKSADMTNCCFIVVELRYNQDADILGLGEITVELINSIDKPGDAIKDYLLNDRYGCAVPIDSVDTASLDDLNTYSDELINFFDVNGNPAQQPRYRINGPVNTAQNCLQNLQDLVDACDSWLQYSDLEDKWKVVINKPYDEAPNAVPTSSLYHVISDYNDNSNLIGGIDINPIDLNASYNIVQVAYPNTNVRDQTDYEIFDFTDPATAWYGPGLLSPNEPTNKLDFELPQVNNYIQAAYLGVRRLLQSREDLTISFQTDYSGIQIEAGDVIRVTSNEYGWNAPTFPDGKLFRVSQVQEVKDEQGNLYAKITAFEYNDTIYSDNALYDYVPSENTGLEDPNIISQPDAPRIYLNEYGSIAKMEVTAAVPTQGLVTNLDFQYGYSSDVESHILYETRGNANGQPLQSVVGTGTGILAIGQQYSITSLGTTNWTSIGAKEIDLSLATVPDGFLTVGRRYIITSIGTTDFTTWGAAANTVGFIFTATGIGDGTGTALETDFVATGTDPGTGLVQNIYTIDVVDLPTGIYYWSVKAKNDLVGINSNSSNAVPWAGETVTNFISNTVCNANSSGNIVTFSPADDDIPAGGNIKITNGDGSLDPNTYIANIISNTSFEITPTPFQALSNACIEITVLDPDTGNTGGGVDGNSIQDGTLTFDKFGNSIYVAANIGGYSFQTSDAGNVVYYPPLDATGFGNIIGSNTATPKYFSNVQYSGSTLDPYPFYQVSSSTADGYLDNSTGVFFPPLAAQLQFYNGFKDWYVAEYVDFNGVRIPEDEFVLFEYDAQYVANVDCTVQFAQFTTSAIDLNKILVDTESFDTIELKANEPIRVDLERRIAVQLTAGPLSTYAYGGGYVLRQLTSGANVICVKGEITAYKTRGS